MDDDRLSEYLVRAYLRDVMGESTEIEMPGLEALADVEAQIKAIDRLGLGAHLANRDFVAYQNRRALVALRDQLRAQQQQEAKHLQDSEHGREPT
jgi:hypothetical protein